MTDFSLGFSQIESERFVSIAKICQLKFTSVHLLFSNGLVPLAYLKTARYVLQKLPYTLQSEITMHDNIILFPEKPRA